MFFDHSKQNGNKNVTIADSASLYVSNDAKYLVIELYNGSSYFDGESIMNSKPSYYPMQRNHFQYQRIIRPLNEGKFVRTDESLFKQNYQMKNLKELKHSIDSLRKDFKLQAENLKTNIVINNIFRNEPRPMLTNDILKLKPLPEHKYTKDSVLIDYDKMVAKMKKEERQQLIQSAINYANSSTMFIKSASDDLIARNHWINRHVIEWHRKFTLSVACLIFFFVGAPLGAIIRKGGLGWPIVISVLFFIFYYVISLMGEKLARESLPAIYGMWISSYVLFPVSIFLTYKATADSSLLQMVTYRRFFKKK
jgi:lipopolysaccharide export system permease protein